MNHNIIAALWAAKRRIYAIKGLPLRHQTRAISILEEASPGCREKSITATYAIAGLDTGDQTKIIRIIYDYYEVLPSSAPSVVIYNCINRLPASPPLPRASPVPKMISPISSPKRSTTPVSLSSSAVKQIFFESLPASPPSPPLPRVSPVPKMISPISSPKRSTTPVSLSSSALKQICFESLPASPTSPPLPRVSPVPKMISPLSSPRRISIPNSTPAARSVTSYVDASSCLIMETKDAVFDILAQMRSLEPQNNAGITSVKVPAQLGAKPLDSSMNEVPNKSNGCSEGYVNVLSNFIRLESTGWKPFNLSSHTIDQPPSVSTKDRNDGKEYKTKTIVKISQRKDVKKETKKTAEESGYCSCEDFQGECYKGKDCKKKKEKHLGRRPDRKR